MHLKEYETANIIKESGGTAVSIIADVSNENDVK